MPSYLCLSVAFLDPAFHGRRDGGEPEWPPSPLRLFQALVAAAASRWREPQFSEYAVPALKWLEAQVPPTIITPRHHTSVPVRIAVPNNDMDVPARFWARGLEPPENKTPQRLKTMKTVRPTRLTDGEAVHFLWELPNPIPDNVREFIEVLSGAARSIVALGWGVDLVAGNGRVLSEADADRLPGERWRPTAGPSETGLRVPTPGTLDALRTRHAAFLKRLDGDGLTPVPALSSFATVNYRRDTDHAAWPFAAFQLLTPDAERFRPFNPRRPHVVVGMVRHAVAEAAKAAGRSEKWIDTYVLGHGPDGPAKGDSHVPRFAYLPLPSLEARGQKGEARQHVVGSIRRVLVVEPPGGTGEQIAWARRALSGRELINEDSRQAEAVLSLLPQSDAVVRHYLGPREGAPDWSTVTPVVLPGHDDANPDKAEGLVRKAIEQAGLPPLLARCAELEWRRVGFRPGLDLATRYDAPAYLTRYPKYHVRLRWKNASGRPVAVRGPIAIGAGRFCGLGLFAADT